MTPAVAKAPARSCRVALFNHKGGVGKTTLTVQIADALTRRGKRVLLVDADPQCNLTSYLIEEAVVNDLLNNSEKPEGRTLWSGVKPVVDGLGDIRTVPPYPTAYGFQLLPGDVRLAAFERELDDFWSDCLQRKARGFLGTTALSRLVAESARNQAIDYVMFDIGPNIGPLNRAVLLDLDAYAIPAACDVFSVRAIATVARAIESWVRDWRTLEKLAPRDAPLLKGRPQFVGYITQQFKTYRRQMSSAFADFAPKLTSAVLEDLVPLLRALDERLVARDLDPLELGAVKEFGSLVTAAQRDGKPMVAVEGAPQEQRDQARAAFDQIAGTLASRTCG